MSLPAILFFVIAIATGLSALAVVFSRNIVRAAVWLLFTLIGISLNYFMLGAEFLGAVLLLLGIYTRAVSLMTLPVILAVAYHWMVRKGFWFSDGGAEFTLAWSFMLITQALLGDGAYALRVPMLPWERGTQRATA